MNLNNLTLSEKAEIEKHISNNLESCLDRISKDIKNVNELDLKIAQIHMDFYYDHIKKYGSANLDRYCNLKSKYIKIRHYKLRSLND